MIPADVDLLKALQDWYFAQCDGSWEHQYGVTISTIDNPGWSLSIDLSCTSLSDKAFAEVNVTGDDSSDWYVCRVKEQVFEGHCGPKHLREVISIFIKWAGHMDHV
jgi:hypothetical protein